MPRLFPFLPAAVLGLVLFGCAETDTTATPPDGDAMPAAPATAVEIPDTVTNPDTALFAGGCFWCMETAYEGREGIVAVISGFAGGTVANPTYNQVTAGGTGHYEVVQVIYDADVIAYERLLEIFWHNVDPFDNEGQFCDRGPSYRPAIFALDAEQQALAEASMATAQAKLEEPITTPILDAAPFYAAEDYHQDFWLKDPDRYYSYRTGCRRDARLEAVWGDDALEDPAVH